jgi:hypothetical protein
MLGDGALSFREWAVHEPLPLATIHDAVLEFLRGRDDAVLFGAQAVNAYVEPPRMTQDVDILSVRAVELVEEIRQFLNERFHIAVRAREIRDGLGYRIYQVQKPRNRHLVDVRPVESLPATQRVQEVLVVSPVELIAGKVRAFYHRRGQPKAFTDRRDLALLLLKFPELKTDTGPVHDRLVAGGAGAEELAAWKEIAAEEIRPENEDDEFTPG